MIVNGTLINYYYHCHRQCYLHGNRINLEDNSEDVRIGKILHEIKSDNKNNTEIKIDNIAIDKITSKYVTELKKSDSDPKAARMQLLYYLKKLKEKGIYREGRLVYNESKKESKTEIIILDENSEKELEKCEEDIKTLIESKNVPEPTNKSMCKKCAYAEYCYI